MLRQLLQDMRTVPCCVTAHMHELRLGGGQAGGASWTQGAAQALERYTFKTVKSMPRKKIAPA